MDEAHIKLQKLNSILSSYPSAIIAFSGGVDSSFLLKVAFDVLGDKVLAVTASSPSVPRKEIEDAVNLAKSIGARHMLVETKELEDENYRKNPSNRCFYCKTKLYSSLDAISKRFPGAVVLNGINFDDLSDYRPGIQACEDWNVKSPLKDAGLTKQEIRNLSKELNLPTYNKPASPCLSSRIPYGLEVSEKKLSQIERGEDFLRGLGLNELRLRHHGDICRIEVLPEQFDIIIKNNKLISAELKKIGFKFVSMDILGFKTGSLNEVLWKPSI